MQKHTVQPCFQRWGCRLPENKLPSNTMVFQYFTVPFYDPCWDIPHVWTNHIPFSHFKSEPPMVSDNSIRILTGYYKYDLFLLNYVPGT